MFFFSFSIIVVQYSFFAYGNFFPFFLIYKKTIFGPKNDVPVFYSNMVHQGGTFYVVVCVCVFCHVLYAGSRNVGSLG